MIVFHCSGSFHSEWLACLLLPPCSQSDTFGRYRPSLTTSSFNTSSPSNTFSFSKTSSSNASFPFHRILNQHFLSLHRSIPLHSIHPSIHPSATSFTNPSLQSPNSPPSHSSPLPPSISSTSYHPTLHHPSFHSHLFHQTPLLPSTLSLPSQPHLPPPPPLSVNLSTNPYRTVSPYTTFLLSISSSHTHLLPHNTLPFTTPFHNTTFTTNR